MAACPKNTVLLFYRLIFSISAIFDDEKLTKVMIAADMELFSVHQGGPADAALAVGGNSKIKMWYV